MMCMSIHDFCLSNNYGVWLILGCQLHPRTQKIHLIGGFANVLMCTVQINTERGSWSVIESLNKISPSQRSICFCLNQRRASSVASCWTHLQSSPFLTRRGDIARVSHPGRPAKLCCEVHLCVSQRGMQDVASQSQHASWGRAPVETARNNGVSEGWSSDPRD